MRALGKWGVGRSWGSERSLAVARSSAALLLLNLLDGLFTLVFLELNVAEEANPLMRWAYERSPLTFMVVKLTVVHLGVAVLGLHYPSRAARLALGVSTAFYAGVFLWHLIFLFRLLPS